MSCSYRGKHTKMNKATAQSPRSLPSTSARDDDAAHEQAIGVIIRIVNYKF